jgi:hypothetical protein
MSVRNEETPDQDEDTDSSSEDLINAGIDSPTAPPREKLQDKIERHLEHSKLHHGSRDKFLPKGLIEKLFDKEDIEYQLYTATSGGNGLQGLVDWVHDKAKKTTATLFQCSLSPDELKKVLRSFRFAHFHDRALPVSMEEFNELSKYQGHPNPAAGPRAKRQLKLKSAFKQGYLWTKARLQKFYHAQFMFLAPTFSLSKLNYEFTTDERLPVVWKAHVATKGGFGTVCEAEIHRDHGGKEFGKVRRANLGKCR